MIRKRFDPLKEFNIPRSFRSHNFFKFVCNKVWGPLCGFFFATADVLSFDCDMFEPLEVREITALARARAEIGGVLPIWEGDILM